jgi:outer membrane protein assembly factor BamB
MYTKMLTAIIGVALPLAGVHGASGGFEKATLCHCPWGKPDECVTLTIGAPAAAAHLALHPRDSEGMCPPKLLWETVIDLGEPVWSTQVQLAAKDTMLVFLPKVGDLFAPSTPLIGVSPKDGSMLWRTDSGFQLLGGLSAGDNVGRIFSASRETWYYDYITGECVQSAPNLLHGFDTLTGEKIIESPGHEVAHALIQTPRDVVVRGVVYGSHCEPGWSSYRLTAHDSTTGEADWHHYLPGYTSDADVAATRDGSTIFATGWSYPDDCWIYAYDAETGAIKWSETIEDACDHPLQDTGRLAVSPKDDRVFLKLNPEQPDGSVLMTLHAYDVESGVELWQSQPLPGYSNIYQLVMSQSGKVLVVRGILTAGINAADGSLLWSNDSLVVASTATTPTTVVLSGKDPSGTPGVTMAVQPETGATVWRVEEDTPDYSTVLADTRGRRIYVTYPTTNGIFVKAYGISLPAGE